MDNLFKCIIKDNYLVDKKTSIPFENMASSPNTKMPPLQKNKGLYGGEQYCSPWFPKSEIPTATNYMKLLKDSDFKPPPGAAEQYVELNRLGNNFSPAPKVKWYYDTDKLNCGPFNIKGL